MAVADSKTQNIPLNFLQTQQCYEAGQFNISVILQATLALKLEVEGHKSYISHTAAFGSPAFQKVTKYGNGAHGSFTPEKVHMPGTPKLTTELSRKKLNRILF